jgi:hypothetical protein
MAQGHISLSARRPAACPLFVVVSCSSLPPVLLFFLAEVRPWRPGVARGFVRDATRPTRSPGVLLGPALPARGAACPRLPGVVPWHDVVRPSPPRGMTRVVRPRPAMVRRGPASCATRCVDLRTRSRLPGAVRPLRGLAQLPASCPTRRCASAWPARGLHGAAPAQRGPSKARPRLARPWCLCVARPPACGLAPARGLLAWRDA